ncbi:sugar phosphate isomerase/epimerase, partial [Christensenellaceae bacterium OttesenSCG-928-M15]|nr:sugar phosphate isomerase/epimerase [Christensenellaceae bacterium OttesenSCG-928-M15]
TEISFPDRVRVAKNAGFSGVGLRAENYWDAEIAGLSDRDMLDILLENGLRVTEVEYLSGWGGESTFEQQEKENTIFHMAELFGVKHVNAGLLHYVEKERAIEGFQALCARAAPLVVALEFLPYGGICTIEEASAFIEGAGCENAGLLLDCWHFARSGAGPGSLLKIDVSKIIALQLADVRQTPYLVSELRKESLHDRLPPGCGHGHNAALLKRLRELGAMPEHVSVGMHVKKRA